MTIDPSASETKADRSAAMPITSAFQSFACAADEAWCLSASSRLALWASAFQGTELPRPEQARRRAVCRPGHVSGMIKHSEPI
jgi:hypothetical protein